MKRKPASNLTLSTCVSVSMLLILLFATDTVHAKRGCSAFGHSCFGGHGKRFDPRLRDNALRGIDKTASNTNQMYDDRFSVSERNLGRQPEVIPLLQVRPPQGPSRFDPYTLSFIVGQWVHLVSLNSLIALTKYFNSSWARFCRKK